MPITDTELRDALAPIREVEPTEEEIQRVIAAAQELRAPRPQRRRPARAVAVVAATAAVVGALAALPGGDATRPQDAHGILQAAAAVAGNQPAPGAYRYTRVRDLFVYDVRAGADRRRATEEQTSENWTSDAFAGQTVAPKGTVRWDAPPTAAILRYGTGAVVKAYDGPFRYGDGPLARVPFAAIPDDATAAGRLLEDAIRDGRWLPDPKTRPHWAPGVVEDEVTHSAVLLLALGNLTGAQRQALFGVLSTRPGARALGDVTDAVGRHGVGVALGGDRGGLRVIIDPETGDILQSSETGSPPPEAPPKLPAGVRKPPWPPPVWLVERTEVFLSTGSVAALGERP